MDENDSPQNRSNDDAELSKSFDENSIIGKMKVGVSRILPNSLSKWLSPKVDVTNARRRRHDEIESDDDNLAEIRRDSPVSITSDNRYITTPQLSVPPPNKKKKTFTEFLHRNTYDLNSPSTTTPSISDRSNIVSSTLIDDVPHRYSSHENGQHATNVAGFASTSSAYVNETTHENDRYNNDEVSSPQNRDKPKNLFTINNNSSVVNFSAHLQRAKSLFTNNSYLSPRLKNYRMRNPRSSLYRSTSSLCDNNSVSSNASSAMSSPFYNGQTTFGGASATSRRMCTTTTTDVPIHHRPKVPTNLVTSRSTSSINTIGGTSTSASMSTTAKRILDLMSKYNTPLTEVRRISNALPSIAETVSINKRKSILDLEMTSTTNDNDKSKRTLLKPNTPYNRPFGRNPVETAHLNELHVPSMPELLQLKKFATNTVKIRDIANKSDNILNRPVSSVADEFKLSTTPTKTKNSSEIDNRAAIDNNNKFVNNKNDTISVKIPSSDAKKDHRNKIRNNLTKRNLGKRADDGDAMPEPVNLPNISLVMDKKTEIKFSEMKDPLKLSNANDSKSIGNNALDNGPQIPFKFKSSNTNTIITPTTKECTSTNGNSNGNLKSFDISPKKSTTSTLLSSSSTAAFSNKYISTDLTGKSQQTQKISRESTSIYRFSEPIILRTTLSNKFEKQHNDFGDINTNYIFSEPIYVTDDTWNKLIGNDSSKTFNNFKFDPKQIKGVPSDSGIADTQSSFGSNFSKSTVNATTTPKKISEFGKLTSSSSNQLKEDDTFKSLVAKQKQGKWECKDCCVSNESTVNKCVCCGSIKIDEKTTVKNKQNEPTAVVDDVFKSIVAKQKQSKWECKVCNAQNDQAESKCLCCGDANPNASSTKATDIKLLPTKQSFSFGALPSSSTSNTSAASNQPIDSVFKSIVDKQKSKWECSACSSANDVSKSKCACCEQSRDVTKGATTSEPVPIKPQFTFGNSSAIKSGFSIGSNPDTVVSTTSSSSLSFGYSATVNSAAQFSFGNLKNNETVTKANTSMNDGKNDMENAKDSMVQKTPQKEPAASAQFSFGKSQVLPSTSNNETNAPKLAAASADSIFKSIVDKQKCSSWECTTCMTRNSNNDVKCMCCETSKDGNTSKKQEKNECLSSSQKFVFGTPNSSGSSTISFGSKPENKTSFTSSSCTTTFLSSTTTATPIVPSSTTNLFGNSQSTIFHSTTNKPNITTETIASGQPSSALGGFKFGFGLSPATPTFGCIQPSKDEIDTGTSSKIKNQGIAVLENVLIKPAATTNGPTELAPTPQFGFNQTFPTQKPATITTDHSTGSHKRPNSESSDNNLQTKVQATTSTLSAGTSFTFGQPQNANNTNTFSAIASNPTTNLTRTPNSFGFGMNKPTSTNAFSNEQPSFSFSPTNNSALSSTPAQSPFGGSGTNATAGSSSSMFNCNALPSSSQPASLNTAQPIFNSSVFSQQPAATQPTVGIGGFKAGSTFGSSTTAFGTSSLNATAQQQTTPSPVVSNLFQYGSTNNNQSASLSSEPQKLGGFSFSLSTPQSFNFGEQSTQQANVPFQFGAQNDAPNLFAAQSANTNTNPAAVQQRRKIRPIRRVNRPSTQF